MHFLIDASLPRALAALLRQHGHEGDDVRDLGMRSAADDAIATMATSQDFVNLHPTSAVLSDWLRIIFMADRNALLRFRKGSVHKTIYFPEWLSVHVALPPLDEQAKIAEKVDHRLSTTKDIETQVASGLARAARLRQAILRLAFERELVPQVAGEEPAAPGQGSESETTVRRCASPSGNKSGL